MSKKEYHPCSKEKGFCVSLDRVAQPAGDGRPKGLSYFAIVKMGQLEQKKVSMNKLFEIVGVVYRIKAGDNGVLLNHCPFCGEDLRPFREGVFEKAGEVKI